MKEGKSEYKPCPFCGSEKINHGMKRICIDSHFELVSGPELPCKKIIQIWPEQVYENAAGYAVFLCEVEGLPSEE